MEKAQDKNSNHIKISKELLNFIDESPSCYHVIDNIKKQLKGYTELKESDDWTLEAGKGYYVVRNSSSIISFKIPSKIGNTINGFKIAAAHSDFPTFKIKTNGEIEVNKHYVVLNTEKYGGMIMSTWFDRPLSIAGRVYIEENGHLKERHINIDRDLLIIPSVAIHMNRDINEGYKFNAQIDTLPLYRQTNDDEKGTEYTLTDLIADYLDVDSDNIMGTDLFLYNRAKGTILGANNEFIASRSLDDLQCTYSLVRGFITADMPSENIPVCCIFDNEEVGSLTKQGADSTFLRDVLERINECITSNEQHISQSLSKSFMISADNAHAVHPNHTELADPTNKPYINGGIVIKFNANQKYTTDGQSEAFFRLLCKETKVPVQEYTNRSNQAGGSTLGNLSNRHVSVKTVDIGLPQLSMHSAYETAGAYDTEYLINVMAEYFK